MRKLCFIFLAVFALTAIGCGGDDDEEEKLDTRWVLDSFPFFNDAALNKIGEESKEYTNAFGFFKIYAGDQREAFKQYKNVLNSGAFYCSNDYSNSKGYGYGCQDGLFTSHRIWYGVYDPNANKSTAEWARAKEGYVFDSVADGGEENSSESVAPDRFMPIEPIKENLFGKQN